MSINENTLPAQYRDINIVTAEIRTITISVKKIMVATAIELGRRLVEAKEMLPHGEWGEWLKREVDFSQSTANNLMKIYREYGSEQESLFGEANSQTFENLTYSQAILLLKVPEDEREEFVQANDVEKLSTKELEQAIKAKQDAEAQRDKERKARVEAEAIAKTNHADMEKAQKAAAAARRDADKALKDMDKAMEEARAARRDLQELKDNPQVPEEVMEKLRSQFRKQAEDAEARAKKAEAALKLASPETATFKVQIEGAQQQMNAAVKTLQLLKEKDPDTAAKLKRAVMAVIDNVRMAAAGI